MCIFIVMAILNVIIVTADGISNSHYEGTFRATNSNYITTSSNNCVLHAVKCTNSGTKRYANASNPTSYYIGPYDTMTRGFNATYSSYYKCDSSGENTQYSAQQLIIIADSMDHWYDYFGNISHLIINYYDLSYIKTY